MPRCIRCAIDGDDVTMHNGAWVHRAPGICFKKLRDVVESLQRERTDLRARLAEAERVTEDAKNLDWLDKQIDGVHVEVHYYGESHGGKRTATVYTWDKEYEAENVRAALTAARGGG